MLKNGLDFGHALRSISIQTLEYCPWTGQNLLCKVQNFFFTINKQDGYLELVGPQPTVCINNILPWILCHHLSNRKWKGKSSSFPANSIPILDCIKTKSVRLLLILKCMGSSADIVIFLQQVEILCQLMMGLISFQSPEKRPSLALFVHSLELEEAVTAALHLSWESYLHTQSNNWPIRFFRFPLIPATTKV